VNNDERRRNRKSVERNVKNDERDAEIKVLLRYVKCVLEIHKNITSICEKYHKHL
jgi:hypothetical protein